jgi:hypothetical protein
VRGAGVPEKDTFLPMIVCPPLEGVRKPRSGRLLLSFFSAGHSQVTCSGVKNAARQASKSEAWTASFTSASAWAAAVASSSFFIPFVASAGTACSNRVWTSKIRDGLESTYHSCRRGERGPIFEASR